MKGFDPARQSSLWRAAIWGIGAVLWLSLWWWWRDPLPALGLRVREHLGAHSRQIALSFDDSPRPLSTPLLLAALDKAQTSASFFIIGESARHFPELTMSIVRAGHPLENHSAPHRNLTLVAPIELEAHIEPVFALIEALEAGQKPDHTGADSAMHHSSTLFRPPGGGLDRAAIRYLWERDHVLAWWSNNPGDWTSPPAWKVADDVKARLRPGDILLLHDGGTGTAQALGEIVRFVRAQGLEPVAMPRQTPTRFPSARQAGPLARFSRHAYRTPAAPEAAPVTPDSGATADAPN